MLPLRRFRQGPSYSPNRLVQSSMFVSKGISRCLSVELDFLFLFVCLIVFGFVWGFLLGEGEVIIIVEIL